MVKPSLITAVDTILNPVNSLQFILGIHFMRSEEIVFIHLRPKIIRSGTKYVS